MAQRFTTVEDFPAVAFVAFASGKEINTVYSGELINIAGQMTNQKLGTVISSAVANSEDPIAAYNRAVELGHETHYAFSIGASLTSHKREKMRVIRLEQGQKIRLEGKVFEVRRAANENANLVEVK